ncbi:hypothetical protein TNCV_747891 [Trichonephila clavipes]|nr:hypothetical protein TNCV_747891 [Trichonephila clavipes]
MTMSDLFTMDDTASISWINEVMKRRCYVALVSPGTGIPIAEMTSSTSLGIVFTSAAHMFLTLLHHHGITLV